MNRVVIALLCFVLTAFHAFANEEDSYEETPLSTPDQIAGLPSHINAATKKNKKMKSNSLFKWSYETTVEVDLPLEKVWDFLENPANCSKWRDDIEFCHSAEPLQTGSIIKVKMKNHNVYASILITEYKPYSECKTRVKGSLGSQESSAIFQEISHDRTRLILKFNVKSFLTPFLRSYFLKKTRSQIEKTLRILHESMTHHELTLPQKNLDVDLIKS